MSDPNTLLNYQGYSNGLTFGPGTDVQLVEIDGLRDSTTIQSGDIPRARLAGAAPGTNTMGERVLTLTFMVFAPVASFETVLAAIAAAFQPQGNPNAVQLLQFMLPGWSSPRQVVGRTTAAALPIDTDYQFNKATIVLQFTCPDPMIYDSVLQTVSTGLPSPTAGLTFPATPPFVFGASSGGSVQTMNTGNKSAPFVVTITGPCTNPVLSLGGSYLGFNVALGGTDTLVIDTGGRTAILNGTASRAGTILAGSTWLKVPVGSSSIGVGSSDSAAVTAVFNFAYRNTWGYM